MGENGPSNNRRDIRLLGKSQAGPQILRHQIKGALLLSITALFREPKAREDLQLDQIKGTIDKSHGSCVTLQHSVAQFAILIVNSMPSSSQLRCGYQTIEQHVGGIDMVRANLIGF
jgi:hypothetical protein